MQPGIHPHVREELIGPLPSLLLGRSTQFGDRTADDTTHGMTAVKGRVGVLEHDLDGTDVFRRTLAQRGAQRLTIELNDTSTVGIGQTEEHLRQGGLSGAGLAHQSQRFASLQLERDIAKHAYGCVIFSEGLGEPVQFDDRVFFG